MVWIKYGIHHFISLRNKIKIGTLGSFTIPNQYYKKIKLSLLLMNLTSHNHLAFQKKLNGIVQIRWKFILHLLYVCWISLSFFGCVFFSFIMEYSIPLPTPQKLVPNQHSTKNQYVYHFHSPQLSKLGTIQIFCKNQYNLQFHFPPPQPFKS